MGRQKIQLTDTCNGGLFNISLTTQQITKMKNGIIIKNDVKLEYLGKRDYG